MGFYLLCVCTSKLENPNLFLSFCLSVFYMLTLSFHFSTQQTKGYFKKLLASKNLEVLQWYHTLNKGKRFSFWCWRAFVLLPTVQVFIFYVFKEINFKWFLISGLALLHCHADFHMVLLKIKYQWGRHGSKEELTVLDISGHLNVQKACEGRGGTGQPGPELSVPGREWGNVRWGGMQQLEQHGEGQLESVLFSQIRDI